MSVDQSIGLPVLHQAVAKRTPKIDAALIDERSAIHSGKLGDIIYALPTCRALGINHLVLNIYHEPNDPLRRFPLPSAREIVALLLQQPYLDKVSIVSVPGKLEDQWSPPGKIDFNLDLFRNVARHRAGKVIFSLPKFARFRASDPPAHLAEMFAAGLGIRVPLHEPWLTVPKQGSSPKVVVSVTRNWRSYPDRYWKIILDGLSEIAFVGHQKEWETSGITEGDYFPTRDHFELASLIGGASLFLGTVSFPYALAEGLKVKRAVEICHRNLNAFPIGSSGYVLPTDVSQARTLIAGLLPRHQQEAYRKRSRQLSKSPSHFIFSRYNSIRTYSAESNHTFTQTLRFMLARWKRAIDELLETRLTARKSQP